MPTNNLLWETPEPIRFSATPENLEYQRLGPSRRAERASKTAHKWEIENGGGGPGRKYYQDYETPASLALKAAESGHDDDAVDQHLTAVGLHGDRADYWKDEAARFNREDGPHNYYLAMVRNAIRLHNIAREAHQEAAKTFRDDIPFKPVRFDSKDAKTSKPKAPKKPKDPFAVPAIAPAKRWSTESEIGLQGPMPEDEIDAALDSTTAHQAAREEHAKTLADKGGLSKRERKEWEEQHKYLSTRELLSMKKGDLKTFLNWHKATAKALGKYTEGGNPYQALVDAARGGQIKRGWYRNASNALKTLFDQGDDAERFAAVLAATSPNTPVDSNLRQALNIWEGWNEAGRPGEGNPREVKKWMAGWFKEAYAKDKKMGIRCPWGAFANNASRALAYTGDWKDFQHSGLKVNSFFHNLRGNLQQFTNDTHIAHMGGISAQAFSKKGGYAAFNVACRKALGILNATLPEEEHWTPAELQETVWSFFRTLAKVQGREQNKTNKTLPKGSKLTSPVEDPEKSKEALYGLTVGDLKDTQDFLSMVINDPHIEQQLKRIDPRLGKGLSSLRKEYAGLAQTTPEEKSTRAVEGTHPILENISRYARPFGGPWTKRPNLQASQGHPIKLSSHIQEVLAFLE